MSDMKPVHMWAVYDHDGIQTVGRTKGITAMRYAKTKQGIIPFLSCPHFDPYEQRFGARCIRVIITPESESDK